MEARRPRLDALVRRFSARNMWIFGEVRGVDSPESQFWLEHAIKYTKPLEARKHDRDVHDLGLLFFTTYHRWYRLTRRARATRRADRSGPHDVAAIQGKGEYLRSFVGDNSLFIDIMMNAGIIFYAARETGIFRLRDIALRHSLPRDACWCAATDPPPTKGFSTPIAAKFCGRRRTRVIEEIPVGRAA